VNRLDLRLLGLAVAAAVSLAGALALGQQPPPGQPPGMQVPPGQMQRPGFPSGHPSLPGMPGQQQRGGPIMLGPDGRPVQSPRPGRPGHPGAPGGPGGPGTRPGAPPHARPHAPASHEEAEEEHGEHECPGHGPDDAPPRLNYWHGMLMVNNELAQKPGFLNQLLFRYEDPHHPCDPRNEPPPYLASLLNFGVLAFILFRFGRKPLGEALVARKQAIMAEIDTATRLKEDAEARLDDYEEKIENIEAKLEEVRAQYAAEAEIEKKHILAEAEERRTRMRRDAEFRVEQERKAVREELLREAVVNATLAAEALIAKQVSTADQDRMATQYLSSIGAALSPKPRTVTGAQAS
jgi:F-type H+-transporting ATPase subunit b